LWYWQFTCRSCGFSEDREPGQANLTWCPTCGSKSSTSKQMNVGSIPQSRVGVDGIMKENVRYSRSMGVRPDEVAKAERAFPGSEYLPDGRLVIHNRLEKVRRMKERGMQEMD
jgi:hypothetical protein